MHLTGISVLPVRLYVIPGMIKSAYDHKVIASKEIYTFENHATALLAWAAYRRTASSAPILITLDDHTDTCVAFVDKLSLEVATHDLKTEEFFKLVDDEARKIDFMSPDTVTLAVEALSHDEHIDAAIRANIIRNAFVICNAERSGTLSVEEEAYETSRSPLNRLRCPDLVPLPEPCRPFSYEMPANGCFIVGSKHGRIELFCKTDSANKRLNYDRALESDYLNAKLVVAREMAANIGITDLLREDFILDIDLDYFHSRKAVRPSDPAVFHELIRRSGVITIALEPDFIGDGDLQMDECDVETNPLNSEFLLAEILEHIAVALS